MALHENVFIAPINAKALNKELGRHFYDGKRVFIDAFFIGADNVTLIYSSWIHVGTGGNIVFEQKDGATGVILNAVSGEWIPLVARRILSSGTPADGGPSVVTTATNMTYHGGI